MTASAIGRVEINGEPPRADDLRLLVGTNYGHFTSMQVERRGARGLQLHLDRLVDGTRELFGSTLYTDHVRAYLRHAIGDDGQSLSLRVSVFSRAFDRERPSACAGADVLVAVGRSAVGSAVPMTVKSFRFERTEPKVKHAGTFPLFHYRRLAQTQGYDDALFVDQHGCVSEGSVWNVAFFDGDRVVWPDAPHLRGVSMQLLQGSLARAGIRSTMRSVALGDIGRFRTAFFTNSAQPVRPIARIDDTVFPVDVNFFAKLESCYASNPLEPI